MEAKKILLLWCSITGVIPFCSAETPFPPIVDNSKTLLTLAESPYLCASSIRIPRGSQLDIQPGVVVKFAPGKGIDVFGKINVAGDENNKVLFTLNKEQISDSNQNPHIRLVGGPTEDKGTLLVEVEDGSFVGVCDARLGDLEYEQRWAKNIVKIVCNELGYVPSDSATLYHGNTPADLLQGNRLTCNGEEEHLSDCIDECCWACDTDQHILGVDCSSVKIGLHWGGLHFATDAHSAESTMSYLTIDRAGVRVDGYGTARLVPALLSYRTTPHAKNVTVTNAAGHGIMYSQLEDKSSIKDLTVKSSNHHGLYVTSYVDEIEMKDLTVEGNGGDGILVTRIPSTNFNGDDFCELTCIRCLYQARDFPLYYTWEKTTSIPDRTCQKTFTTTVGNVLAFKVLNASNNVHISLRDGAHTNSPFVWSAEVEIGQWSNPPPVIVTTTNSITVKMVSTFYRYYEFVKFAIFSGPQGSFGTNVVNIKTINNGGSGIKFLGIQMPLHISDIMTLNNTNGLEFRSCSSYVNAVEIQSHFNRKSGLLIDDTDGRVTIESSAFTNNKANGITSKYARACSAESVSDRYALDMHLENNLISNNTGSGFFFDYKCRYNLTLKMNIIKYNAIRSVSVSYSYNHDRNLQNLRLLSNHIESNTYGVVIEGVSSLLLEIFNNTFTENKNTALLVQINGAYYYERILAFFITQNNFIKNRINKGSVVYVSVSYTNTYGRQVNFTITNNVFRDNLVDRQPKNYIYSQNDLSAVVYLNTKSFVNLQYNQFKNPGALLELATGDQNPNNIIDARFSFWGTNDVTEISRNIYAYHQSYIMSKVLYHPYLNSEDSDNFTVEFPNQPNFEINQKIGGYLYKNYTLSDTQNVYTVTRDVVVGNNATLTINKGVRLQFKPGAAVLVYGRLNIIGTPDQYVELTADQTNSSEYVRLVGGNNPWEGVVQVLVNQNWLSLCAHSSDITTRDFLCYSVDYQHSVAFSSVSNDLPERVTGPLKCSSNRYSSCKMLSVDKCSGAGVMFLQCSPNYWSGIHLTVHAKPSHLNYVHFSHTGYLHNSKSSKAAIEVDYNQHKIQNINIDDSYNEEDVAGIIIRKQDALNNNKLSGIYIKKYRGSGIISYDSRSSISNSIFENIGINNHHGVYIGSSMVEIRTFNYSLVHSICFQQEYELKDNDNLFIRIHDVVIPHWHSCSILLRANVGKRIVIQVISGVVGLDRSCGQETLLFHDGHRSEVQGIGVLPNNDGHVWLSTSHIAHLVMNRMYHHSDECMDLTLSIKTFTVFPTLSKGLVLSNIKVKNFNHGIYLNQVLTGSALHNISCFGAYSQCISIYDCQSQVNITNSIIDSSGEGGILSRYFRGNITISSTKFLNNKQKGALTVWNANYNEEHLYLNVLKCEFSQNDKAVEVIKSNNRHRRYPNSWRIVLSDNLFYKNEEVLNVSLATDNHFGHHYLVFQNNVLNQNVKGLIFAGKNYIDMYMWEILNNKFNNFSNSAMELKGSGVVSGNVISNSNNPDSNIVDIEAVYFKFFLTDNEFIDNTNSRHVLHLDAKAYNVSINGNIFSKNRVDDAVLSVNSWLPNKFDILPQLSWNRFVNNTSIDDCRESTAFLLKGYRRYECEYNIFDNPQLKSEITVAQTSENSSTVLNMEKNYWGDSSIDSVLSRLSDGRLFHSKVKVQLDPFCEDSNLTKLVHNASETNMVKADNILRGLISRDTTLSTSNPIYDILGDLEVPTGVTLTLPEGIILLLQPDSSIHVYGSVEAKGSLHKPVIIQRGHFHQIPDCFSKVRLVDRQIPTEGRLEILEAGKWKSVCREGWTYENAKVVCRLLGYGSPITHYYNAVQLADDIIPSITSQQIFQCSGNEPSLRLCRHRFLTHDCTGHDPVGMVCSLTLPKPGVFLSSLVDEMPSVLENVYFGNISSLQVSGVPPVVENLTIWDSDTGLTYLGTGVANEKDVTLKNVEIMRSGKNGISLYDITSNVTIDHAIINNVGGHGIYFSPSYDDEHLHAANGMKSTFHFCDAETVLNIQHGEEYKYFSNDGFIQTGCRRLFRTLPGYAVRIQLKAYTDNYDWQPVAAIYDGNAVDDNRMLLQFNTIREDRGPQVSDVLSLGNEMTVWVYSEEKDITFASITSVPARENDCSFEDGMCGWHNAEDIYALERGMWFMYSCSTLSSAAFKGLDRDVNFPSGIDGHYMVVGETSTNCNHNDARYRRSETAILESPVYKNNRNLCSVTFYHYRSIAHYYRSEHLTLYMKTDDGLQKLWVETSQDSYDKWTKTSVQLQSENMPETFTLVFFAEFMKDCPNSVGIDDIKFHRCPEEKLVSTIRVVNTALQYIPQIPIYMRNNDYQKHNIIWIEKVSILDSGLFAGKDTASITVDMKSAYVLIRNVFMDRIHHKAIDVQFDSNTKYRISEVSISQNSIEKGSLGGVIYVNNKGINNAATWITGNNIMHNSAFDRFSIIQIVNSSLTMHSNLIYNNSGKYILELGSSRVTNILPQKIENNTFWFNAAQKQASEFTVSLNASKVNFHGNVLNNPANLYEVSARRGIDKRTSKLWCTSNWWGSGRLDVAKKRIRDGKNTHMLPSVLYLPILNSLPSHFGLSSSCPLGWTQHRSYCYFFNGGAVTYAYAQYVCEQNSALLMMNDSIVQEYLQHATKYRDVDGTTKYSAIWIDASTENVVDSLTCHTLQYQNNQNFTISINLRLNLHPFVCQKLSVTLCKNGCFQHGLCIGKTCLCDKGWDKEDCSLFHCRDVNNCSGTGICVGPNNCKCKPGWMGRACSISYCSRFGNCRTCTKKTGCGWCDTKRECLPGTGTGAIIGEQCPDWFYYKCMTLEQSTDCTSQVNKLECNSRYCNANNTLTDRGLCQRCKDIQNCFSIQGKSYCYSWDEKKCPKGAPVPNYSDTSRIHNTVFQDNVKIVTTDILLYFCPYKVSENPLDSRHLFITAKQKLPFKQQDIITSAQSDGVMHKVEYMTLVNDLYFILGTPVGLKDLVKYADFSQTVVMEALMHPLTQEQEPDKELMILLLNKDIVVHEDMHVIPVENKVFKCTGHVYEGNEGISGTTYYLVLPDSQLPTDLREGHIIIVEKTHGFLENVIGIIQNNLEFYVETNLTHCKPNSIENIQIDFNFGKSAMNCYGGNGYPGLIHFESLTNPENVNGKTIIGRKSKPVIAKVLNVTTVNGYSYVEVIDVDYEDNGTLVVSADPAILTEDRRRTRRAPTNFVRNVAKTFSYDVGKDNLLNIRPSGSIKATFDPTVEVDWDWDKMEVEWEIGAQFSGQINVGVSLDLQYKGDVNKKGGPTELFQKQLPAFYIPVGNPPTPVAGTAEFKLEFTWEVTASGEGSFKAYGHTEGNTAAGFAMAGLPKPPNKFDGFSDGNVTAVIMDASVSAMVTVKPKLLVKWPAVLTTMTPYSEKPPKSVRDIIAIPLPAGKAVSRGHSPKVLPFMQVIFGAPLEVHASATTCDTSCINVYKPMRTEVESKVGKLEVMMTGLNIVVDESHKHESMTFRSEKCEAQEYDCCTCEETGEPGKWNQFTGQCLCYCCCDMEPVANYKQCKLKGFKNALGQCSCNKCPDNSLQRFWSDIKCPCTCKDGIPKEMSSDGSCDCSCTCRDGSMDVLDEDGKCPCECQCNNCDVSFKGGIGCVCPNDICPVCEAGAEPQWINCECQCPEPECGIPPTCVHGRRGRNCDQPDCSPCHDCYGNGECRAITGECTSFCQCAPQWEGTCCERRRARRAYGDPHIETLDGVWFDYFGIGQFWDCRSERNDFGFQVRYYYYKQTSFTGAVAIKVGESVITISTPSPAAQGDKPFVRKNGELLQIDKAMKVTYHESVMVNIQPSYTSSEEDNEDLALVLISFGFKSGASLTVDVRFSPVMKRQYLNIMYTLTKDFKHQTSGLCGYMDDDSKNDLMGPDGQLYENRDAFVHSWQIHNMVRINGGTRNSWSWTETNFHEDDFLDLSYTDPSYKPSYTISGFTPAQIQAATNICTSLGITGELVDGCIFDVVITNDTSMAEQDTLNTDCPKQCSGKGRCKNGTCQCLDGWSGLDCSQGACGSCFYGDCIAGFCECDVGWDGAKCDVKSTCYSVNACTDEDHGVCDKFNKCLCRDGYTGADCSLTATCYNVQNCSSHGICLDFDQCKCDIGWIGPQCDTSSCEALDYCSHNGLCVGYDVCVCNNGWKGKSCNDPICTDLNDCSGNGECVKPNNCTCYDGYKGVDCSERIPCPWLDDCNYKGICVKEQNTTICRCFSHYVGATCNKTQCPLRNHCSNKGLCTEPNVCDCHSGYGGPNCSQLTCDRLNRCSGHGKCVGLNQCHCDEGWLKEDCSKADCSRVLQCSSQGLCVTPDNCDCFDGYQGQYCRHKTEFNYDTPVFQYPFNYILISETVKTPLFLLTIVAYDTDSGKNGEVRYSLDPAGLPININKHLSIDSITGDIILIKAISTVHVKTGVLNVTIKASDRGEPSQTGTALLSINISEVNDHCPVIIFPAVNQIIYLNFSSVSNTSVVTVKATDSDRGKHGELRYKLANAALDSNNRFFNIGEHTGTLYTLINNVPMGEYPIRVTVMDKSTNPCAIEFTFLVFVVEGKFIPKIIDSTTSSTFIRPSTTYSSTFHTSKGDTSNVDKTSPIFSVSDPKPSSSSLPPLVETPLDRELSASSSNVELIVIKRDNTAVVTLSIMLTLVVITASAAIVILFLKLRAAKP